MFLEGILLFKAFPTFGTLEWTVIRVHSQMFDIIHVVLRLVIAFVAIVFVIVEVYCLNVFNKLIWNFASKAAFLEATVENVIRNCVQSALVQLHDLLSEERLIAHVALKLPDVDMCHNMALHIALIIEPLVAVRTNMKLNSKMSTNVSLQALLCLKLFVALQTWKHARFVQCQGKPRAIH